MRNIYPLDIFSPKFSSSRNSLPNPIPPPKVVWVKQTVHRRLAKSHGYYLQHAKEVCLVARKGKSPKGTTYGTASDIIMSERRGQSQKPEEIYR